MRISNPSLIDIRGESGCIDGVPAVDFRERSERGIRGESGCIDGVPAVDFISIFEKTFGQPVEIHDYERFSILQEAWNNE